MPGLGSARAFQAAGSGLLGLGTFLRQAKLQDEAQARQDALDRQAAEFRTAQLGLQQDAAKQRADDLAFRRATSGFERVDPGADLVAGVHDANQAMQNPVPGPANLLPGVGTAIRQALPTYDVGGVSYRYDPTKNVALQQADQQFERQKDLLGIQHRYGMEEQAANRAASLEAARIGAGASRYTAVPTAEGVVMVDTRDPSHTVRIGSVKPAGSGAQMTESQARVSALLPTAEMGIRAVDDVLAKNGGRVPIGSKWGEVPLLGNYLIGEDFQKLRTGMSQAALSVARMQGGQNLTDSEMRGIAKQYIPEPGEDPSVVQQKLDALRATIAATRNTLGAHAPTSAAAPPAPSANPWRTGSNGFGGSF